MGSKGIKRRKPRRPLPKVHGEVPSENDLIPPMIMWPDKGSGFEADPFSPAGAAQREWWFMNGLWHRRRASVRLAFALWVVPCVAVLLIAGFLWAMEALRSIM